MLSFRFSSSLTEEEEEEEETEWCCTRIDLFITGVGRRPKFHAIKKTQRKKERKREKRAKKTSKTGSHKKMNFIDKNKKPANTGGIDETVKLAAGKLDGLAGMHEYGDRQKDYTWDCVIFGDGS